MLLRERETPKGLLVSVCDQACLGETYENGDITLEVTEDFYGGEDAVDAEPDAIVDALTRASVANIVGAESVAVAVDAGLIDEANVLEVDTTQHAQLMWL
jgi:Uncharacterized conserved protein